MHHSSLKKMLLLKSNIDTHMLKVGSFNTPLLPVDRSFKPKLNREMLELNGIINQIDIRGICITLHLSSE